MPDTACGTFLTTVTVACADSEPYAVVAPYCTQYSTAPPTSLTTRPPTVMPLSETSEGEPVSPVAQPVHRAASRPAHAMAERLPMADASAARPLEATLP